jgi:hypothetical protein
MIVVADFLRTRIDILVGLLSLIDMFSFATFQRRLCHSGNLIAGI